jgi:hypothetical protein
MSFEEMNFTSSPNFRFQEIVSNKSDCLSTTFQFDCYKDKKGNSILITPFFNDKNMLERDYHISLINLKNNSVEKTLRDHKDRVVIVRHFQDKETKNDYFVSTDRQYNVIVWDLSNDCNKIFEKEVKYEGYICSALLLFIKNNKYLVVSSIGGNNVTRVIDINDKNVVREIEVSRNLNIYFLAHWLNEELREEDEDKQNVIIQCGKSKILFSEFPSNTVYHTIKMNESNLYILGAIVFKNYDKDMFAFAESFGLVQIIDLAQKNTVKKIKFDKVKLYSFVRWNDRYLLLNDGFQRRIIVFDILDNYKVKSKVLCPEMNYERFIKKVWHPLYGESILSVGTDWAIKLYVNRDLTKPASKINK